MKTNLRHLKVNFRESKVVFKKIFSEYIGDYLEEYVNFGETESFLNDQMDAFEEREQRVRQNISFCSLILNQI